MLCRLAATSADPHPSHRFPPLPSTSDLPLEADSATKGTPDEWIPRDAALVRLTGKWPLNCEPALPDLWRAGFLTPTRLHYVRNHGVVPRVTPDEGLNWTLDIGGLVSRPCTLTLADLVDPRKFQTVTLPVTLVCAGNRRKEQNVVRQSLGFSWGPAGLSTALYTGVYLADVLDYVQPRAEGQFGEPGYRRPEHVIFEGAEDLPKGKYGTSQRLRAARQKQKGMLLAWAHNGEALEPDHGFPLRLVVPGQIGGRSVKWLKKIEISDNESQHYLHFWVRRSSSSLVSTSSLSATDSVLFLVQDNKVLPTTLTGEEAREQRDWWHDPKFIINDLNVNAAVARPAHDEQLVVASTSSSSVLDSPSPAPQQTYLVEGYVYAGGGRRVTRVEVTFDDGASWSLAQISYPEDDYRRIKFENKKVWGSFDMHERDESFCWAFYKLEVPVDKLVDSSCLAVRAMDESLHLMGKTMYWKCVATSCSLSSAHVSWS